MDTCTKCSTQLNPEFNGRYKKCWWCRFCNMISQRKRRGTTLEQQQNIQGLDFSQINCENQLLLRVKILDKINSHKNYDISKNFDINEIIDFEYVYVLMYKQKGKCFYCDCNLKFLHYANHQQNQFSLDRIDSINKGHCKGNILLSCLNCNIRKGQKSPKEFKEQLRKENLNRINFVN